MFCMFYTSMSKMIYIIYFSSFTSEPHDSQLWFKSITVVYYLAITRLGMVYNAMYP